MMVRSGVVYASLSDIATLLGIHAIHNQTTRKFECSSGRFMIRLAADNPFIIATDERQAETISQMVPRYDQAINAWGGTWGSRNRVVAAINGSFYNTSTGMPHSGIVHSGVYTKWYRSLGGSGGFAWTLDRQAFIGAMHVIGSRMAASIVAAVKPGTDSLKKAFTFSDLTPGKIDDLGRWEFPWCRRGPTSRYPKCLSPPHHNR
jgi:hypothetical protein